jgi:feruloyl esterase
MFGFSYKASVTVVLAGYAVLLFTLADPLCAGQAVPVKTVANLEAFCKPGIVQSALVGVSPAASLKEIPNGPKFPGGTRFVAAAKDWPAYCQVTGSFVTNEKTGKTANFLATLPANWNGKFLQFGCGGHCGGILGINDAAQPSNTIVIQGYPGENLIKGYASFGTDQGHDSPEDGLWAIKGPGRIDEDAVDDFYYRADQMLARMGKQFTTSFYARAMGGPQNISYSYFGGCSEGGRDALVAASYFPEEFDGIISGSPYGNPMANSFQWGDCHWCSCVKALTLPPL